MKSSHELKPRPKSADTDETVKKAVKLPPIKKSGKERHKMFSQLDEEDDDELDFSYRKKESTLDYFDDSPEDDFDNQDDYEDDEVYEDDYEDDDIDEDYDDDTLE